MSDIERTLEEQPGSPDADASGDSERPRGKASKHAAASSADAPCVSESDTAPPHGDPTVPRTSGGAVHGSDEGAAEVQGDLDELVKTSAQRDEYLALAQRTQADFENYRKRIARESAAAQERGMAALAKELLPALDNLDRALADAGKAAAGQDGLLEGVRLVRSELAAGLARAGIESFSPVGEAFDPSLHEAVATAPQPENGCPSGIVVEVYQPGYRLGASVIRPARVVVAA